MCLKCHPELNPCLYMVKDDAYLLCVVDKFDSVYLCYSNGNCIAWNKDMACHHEISDYLIQVEKFCNTLTDKLKDLPIVDQYKFWIWYRQNNGDEYIKQRSESFCTAVKLDNDLWNFYDEQNTGSERIVKEAQKDISESAIVKLYNYFLQGSVSEYI